MEDKVLVRAHVSPPRLWFGILVMAALGGILLWLSAVHPPQGLGLRVFVLVFGALSLLMAEKMRRIGAGWVELTETELRDHTGRTLALISDIARVDRGALAFKPSNGFVLKLKTKQPRTWLPGLWWRIGRRVGVGGVTVAPQTRAMAETLQARVVAER